MPQSDQRKFPSVRARIVEHASGFIPKDHALYRKPRFSLRSRDSGFYEAFDERALVYDVFRGAKRGQVLLVGPPPRNLVAGLKRAVFSAGGQSGFSMKLHVSQSVMVMALEGVPEDAERLQMAFEGLEFSFNIGENFGQQLAEKRILFTLSKNNSLSWIKCWADYHQRVHGVEALVLVDNGSSNASLADIAAVLETTDIEQIFILSMPYKFGPIDSAVVFDPFWANFLQLCINSIVLRRFAPLASGLLNCDIDEMAMHRSEKSVFGALEKTPMGLLAMKGSWIETKPLDALAQDHRKFGYRLTDKKARVCHASKWVLDPRKDWVQNLNVHPLWHCISGRPSGAKTRTPDAFFWHFKGINTNWKEDRAIEREYGESELEVDSELVEVFSRLATSAGERS